MSVEIGLSTIGADDVAARACRRETVGYDYISVDGDISLNLPTASPRVGLDAAAAVTSRVKLMTSIPPAPIYPLALLAKMTATLDHISDGRFELGVGAGGEKPRLFVATTCPEEFATEHEQLLSDELLPAFR